MDAFDTPKTESALWQLNCDSLEDLEYENALNDCSNSWQMASVQEMCNMKPEEEIPVSGGEYECAKEAFCSRNEQSETCIFNSSIPLVGASDEQNLIESLEESYRNPESEYYVDPAANDSCLQETDSSTLPDNLSYWSCFMDGSSGNASDRGLKRVFDVAENSNSLDLLHERVRLLEEENSNLNLQMSRYKEENLQLREALDHVHCFGFFGGAETVTSACYPESEEDSSSRAQEKRKRRRRREDCSPLEKEKYSNSFHEESRGEETKGYDNERGYFQHKLDSLYLKSDRENGTTSSSVEFVSLVRDLTAPLMKTDPARAATLTMFIFALALGLFNFQCKGTVNTESHLAPGVERVLWNNLQDYMRSDYGYEGKMFSDMKKGFMDSSLNSSPFQDTQKLMESYLYTSAGHVLEETSPAKSERLLYNCDENSLEELNDITRGYVSSWEQMAEMDRYRGEEFGDN